MKKSITIILQIAVVMTGFAVLLFLLWEPHLEGRNVNATLFEIYFNDPFLAFVYIGSIAFYIALYQAFKVIGYAGQNMFVSQSSVKAFGTIKYCAFVLIGFVAVGEIVIMSNASDDRAGGVFMGFLVALGAVFIAAVASNYERKVKNAL